MRATMYRMAVVVALLVGSAGMHAVHAGPPTGACCLLNGSCTETTVLTCEGQDGDYIGDGTECAAIDCGAPVAAPLLSLLGLVGAISALSGLSLYRLWSRRKSSD